MKKLLLSFLIVGMLFAYPVKAEVTQADLTSQLEVLKQQLINELLKQIAVLQAQITEILASQVAQGEKSNQITENKIPTAPAELQVSCSGVFDGNDTITWTALASGGDGNYKYAFESLYNTCRATTHCEENCGKEGSWGNVISGGNCNYKNNNVFVSKLTDFLNPSTASLVNSSNVKEILTRVFIKSGNQVKYAGCMIK